MPGVLFNFIEEAEVRFLIFFADTEGVYIKLKHIVRKTTVKIIFFNIILHIKPPIINLEYKKTKKNQEQKCVKSNISKNTINNNKRQ